MVRDVIVPSRGASLLRESYSGIGDIVWTGKASIGRPPALQGGTPFLRRGTETCAQFRFIAARGKFSRALPAQHVTWPEQQLGVTCLPRAFLCIISNLYGYLLGCTQTEPCAAGAERVAVIIYNDQWLMPAARLNTWTHLVNMVPNVHKNHKAY